MTGHLSTSVGLYRGYQSTRHTVNSSQPST